VARVNQRPAGAAPRVQGVALKVTCTCGQSARVPVGEVGRCDRCGRRWDTAKVPAEEYRAYALAVRRAKWMAFAGVLVVVPVVALLALLVDRLLLLVAPVALGVWYFWYLPSHRKRVRRLYATLPRWEIPSDERPG
jgi:hypothetical protein